MISTGIHIKSTFLRAAAFLGLLGFGCTLQASGIYERECQQLFKNKQFNEAIEPCRSAAIEGSAPSKFHLGMMYIGGWGLEKNTNLGFKLVEDAAYLDHADAVSQMGTIFWSGLNGTRDEKRACDWWEKAAKVGHATGLEKAGVCYMLGKGREKNIVKAYQLLTQAADNGSAGAIYIVNRYKEVFPVDDQVLSDSSSN